MSLVAGFQQTEPTESNGTERDSMTKTEKRMLGQLLQGRSVNAWGKRDALTIESLVLLGGVQVRKIQPDDEISALVVTAGGGNTQTITEAFAIIDEHLTMLKGS